VAWRRRSSCTCRCSPWIDHPSRDTTFAVVLMLCGGPAIFLLARAWYQRRVFAAAARPRLLTIGVLVATVAAVRTAPALVAALAVVAVLAALVVVEQFSAID
jgi:low temperature requirement protein LtrA